MTQQKVYISSYSKDEAVKLRDTLVGAGHDVVSSWHDREFKRTKDRSDADLIDGAARNAGQIASADAVVVITPADYCPGGIYVEAGIAIGLNRPLYALGGRTNNMLWHPLVTGVGSTATLVELLAL